MARSVNGTPIHITCTEWGDHEWVLARTLKLKGDVRWINERSMETIIDQNAPDGIRMVMHTDAAMVSTLARMIIRWNITQDETDATGHVIYGDMGSKPKQVPLVLPDDLEARIPVIEAMNDDDVQHIYMKMQAVAPVQMTQKEQKDFLTSVPDPTSTS